MSTAEIAALLVAAPDHHSQRCAATKSAIDAGRWPAAAQGLRHAATQAQDWATEARLLADWCDVQAANGQSCYTPLISTVSAPEVPVTVSALEAGLMALANSLGPHHSARVLDAISSTFSATHASRRLPTEAVVIGQALDHDSLEQGEPA